MVSVFHANKYRVWGTPSVYYVLLEYEATSASLSYMYNFAELHLEFYIFISITVSHDQIVEMAYK